MPVTTADSALLPAVFVACTVTSYDVPLVRPDTVMGEAAPVWVTAAPPPVGVAVTVNCVVAGVDGTGVNATPRVWSPGVTVVIAGADGTAPWEKDTWAGPPDGFVVTVIVVFQNSCIWSPSGTPRMQAMPTL